MEQINMFNIIESSNNDNNKLFFENVVDILNDANLIELKPKYKNTKTYATISLGDNPADIRIKFGKKASYFSVRRKHKDILKGKYRVDNSDKWLIIDITSPSDAYKYKELFCEIYEERFLKTSPDSFDCCSRYLACSEAGHCVNPYDDILKYCKYRKKLKKGIIFFIK